MDETHVVSALIHSLNLTKSSAICTHLMRFPIKVLCVPQCGFYIYPAIWTSLAFTILNFAQSLDILFEEGSLRLNDRQGCTQDFLVGEEVLREIPSRDNYMRRRRRRRSF